MSVFSGKQFKGAMKKHREKKKFDAHLRNALTKPERTKAYRRTVQVLERLGAAS